MYRSKFCRRSHTGVVVRHSHEEDGMGVEFVAYVDEARTRLNPASKVAALAVFGLAALACELRPT